MRIPTIIFAPSPSIPKIYTVQSNIQNFEATCAPERGAHIVRPLHGILDIHLWAPPPSAGQYATKKFCTKMAALATKAGQPFQSIENLHIEPDTELVHRFLRSG